MILEKKPSRLIPGILTYLSFFSSKKLAYSIFLGTPIVIGVISTFLHTLLIGRIDFFHFFQFTLLFLMTSGCGVGVTILFYSKRSPILQGPPNGWAVQTNVFFTAPMELTLLFGQLLAILFNNITFQEVFFIIIIS